jgi:hypothetical protein
VSIPLDPDGFLRRECQACLRQFKWLPSADSYPPADGFYGCPYCKARADDFWTSQQREYLVWTAGQEALRELESGGFKVEGSPPPLPPVDPADMERVDFTCHPDEPVKVYAGWVSSQPVYCIICGTQA